MLLSVIIPTHNRYRYVVSTIETLLSLGEELEIVVADTSDTNELSAFIANHEKHDYIKHIRPGAGLSVVDNFNAGFKAATGDYLLFLGDDDFITDAVFRIADWAKDNHIDSLKFTFPASYYWPDFKHRRTGSVLSGTLQIAPFSGKVKVHDARHALEEALMSFGDGPMNMPRAYLGMISRPLAQRVMMKYGEQLFGGVSPDVYSAALISIEAESCVMIDYPVIIPGASSASTSGQNAEGKHVGRLRDNAHVGAFKNLQWDGRIPEFYSVPTVWSYSLLKAIDKAGKFQDKVNYSRLFVKSLFYHYHYRREIYSSLGYHYEIGNISSILLRLPHSIFSELSWLAGKAFSRFSAPFRKSDGADSLAIKDLNNVAEARQALKTHMGNCPRSLDLIEVEN